MILETCHRAGHLTRIRMDVEENCQDRKWFGGEQSEGGTAMSVWSYFTSELTRGYLLEREEEKYAQKRERVYTFMKTPRELEKFSIYGFFQCLDAFLFIFTFLPLRILLAVLKIFTLPCGFMRFVYLVINSIIQPFLFFLEHNQQNYFYKYASSFAFTDHSDLVSRRMGLTPLPLACLLYRILSKSVPLSTYMDFTILFLLYLCLMSFKVFNSIVLLGHSYMVIENYDKENHSASSPNEDQEQKTESTNQRPASVEDHAPTLSNQKIHERTASYDEKISRNFSQIFSADSYTELTQVQSDTAIEQTGGFSLKGAKLDYNESNDDVRSAPNDNKPASYVESKSPDLAEKSVSCENINISYEKHDVTGKETNITQNALGDLQSSNESLLNMSCDHLKSSQNSVGESGPAGDSQKQFHTPSIFQRSHRGIFMNFGVGKRTGSTRSLPETVGIQECSEQEECSPIEENVFTDKTEKVE
ncbi:transmembrane anterior posterior transformation protein 1 homolog [Ruditapes philippinarum]|uniref:transmembrane anterior posterior transformation protein 1 homolog n=1 Tax=Ruditapes philippinarum TaxID=129788 RepID=UPI00295B00FB|nr:transmembrane anterior posterior transformation protein 1 homolog [Ruditapes philippinarum]